MKEPGFVMLVEDDEDDVDVTLLAFKRAGLSEVVVARDGVEALEKLAPGRVLPKVIFLDLKMPGLDGIEVLRRVRADERTALLPVVVLTIRPSQAIWTRPIGPGPTATCARRSIPITSTGWPSSSGDTGWHQRGRGVTAGLRALIVEDNPDDVELVKMELEGGGYQLNVRQVTTLEALRQSLNEAWDIIYSDYQLDGFNGEDVLAVVRRERGLDTPFIVVSGSVGEDVAVQAMRAGADDYFRKEHVERLAPATARCLRDADNRRRLAAAERDKRAVERRLRTMLNVAPIAIAIVEGPTNAYTFQNTEHERLFGPCTASPSAVTRGARRGPRHRRDPDERGHRDPS